MFPTLITIGEYPIHWYPVLMALGITVGGWMVLRKGVAQGYDRAMLFDMSWWLVVGGLIGARVTFIIVDFESQYYAACFDLPAYNATYPNTPLTEPDCGRILRWWNGGLVFYGSVIGGMLTLVWFLRKEGLKLLPIADIIIPTLALGQFFGRLGCLSAGCCWGRPTLTDWGLTFPRGSSVFFQHYQQGLVSASATHSAHVHATQLYDSFCGLLLFFVLLWVAKRKTWDGQPFFWWLILYPICRSSVELFRGDDLERGFVFEWVVEPINTLLGLPLQSPTFLSTSQFISLVMMGIGLSIWVKCRHLPMRHLKQE
jgi:phosphatidylglycerol---prolipoprotein diacylglyceryl transferase